MTPARPVTTWSEHELINADNITRNILGVVVRLRALLSALGAVHPAEAREREREAARWMLRRLDAWTLNGGTPDGVIDQLWPSLLPKSPPPLVLANGTEIIKARECGYNIATPNCRWSNVGVSAIGRHATTAEDFIAIAQWLQETPHV